MGTYIFMIYNNNLYAMFLSNNKLQNADSQTFTMKFVRTWQVEV